MVGRFLFDEGSSWRRPWTGPDHDAGGPEEHLQVAGSLRHGDPPHGGVVLRHGFTPADDAVFPGHIKDDDDDDVRQPSRASMEDEVTSRIATLVLHTIAACRTAKRRPPLTCFLPRKAAAAIA
ncbi:Os08g0262832 [Oryza sativa Japonica Group]|uniref:Os08g0262832 protein n=1 Tax=Oryza sativa subsp. japonica TaxID=39947 RepID=A0A0P0XDZ0_ORYSJ|nr:Os08g0262832 [Oryza sativa Japonica Group]